MADIDQLPVQKSVIDLSAPAEGDFGLDDFTLTKVLDDILLVRYIDLADDESGFINRNGLVIPTNIVKHTWRKAEVLLKGPLSRNVEIGDIVIFPSNMGITVSGIDVEGAGIVKKCVFINEARTFGVCKKRSAESK